MIDDFLAKNWTRWRWYVLLILPWLVLLIGQILFSSPPLTCFFGFIAIFSTFLSLTFLLRPAPAEPPTMVEPLPADGVGEHELSLPELPLIPRTLAELRRWTQ